MNWTDLNEIHRRVLSKEMSVKEASDFTIMPYLIRFHEHNRFLWAEESDEVFATNHQKLKDIALAIWLRAHDINSD